MIYNRNTFFHFIILSILIFYLLFFFITCSSGNGILEDEPTDDTEQGTWVDFDNLEDFPVTIYSDPSRQHIVTSVDRKSSKKIAAIPNITGIIYYPTFSIDIPYVQNDFIFYDAPDIITVIEENKTTRVPVPRLESIEINRAYIRIINNSDHSLSFQFGNIELSPLDGRPNIIVPSQNVVYEITPGNVSGFSLRRNTTTPISFPVGLDEFRKGIIYSFTYNGTSLVLTAQASVLQSIPPVAPVNIQANAVSNSSVLITWNEVFGATSYLIYRAADSSTASYEQIGSASALSYTDTTVSAGHTYYYKVSAASSTSNISDKSAPVSVNMSPSGLKMSDNSTVSITLAWNVFNSADGYNIYRSNNESGIYTKINNEPVITATLTDTDVLPDTAYFYKVSCVIGEEFESLLSNSISASTLSSIPANINVSDKTTVSIKLTWDILNGAEGYNVCRSGSESGTYTKLNVDIITGIEFNDIGLSPDTTYYYKVSSINNGVEGFLSDYIKVETVSSIPLNISVIEKTTVSIKLAWDMLNGADGYNVYRSGSENGIYTKINSDIINETEFKDTGLSPDASYYYKISSINGGVDGLQSVPISAETLSSIPSNVRATSATALSISISWDTINGASGYNVYSSESEDGVYSKKNNNVITENVFVDTELSMDTTYYYKVSSINNDAEGLQSAPIFMATSSVPANVWVRTVTGNSVRFTWSVINEASGYNVYRSASENGTYSKINTGIINTAEFTDTSLSADTVYYYKINAVISGVEGILSKTVSSLGTVVPGDTLAAKFNWLSTSANTINNSIYFIEVDVDINSAPRSLSYSGRSGLTIILRGKDQMRTISLSSNGSLFTIGSGVTLILDKNITLKGRSNNNASVVNVSSDGNLVMNTGSKITGNSLSTSITYGSAVYVNSNAIFTMNGGEISGNSLNASSRSYGGGVYITDGTFTMNGGEISGNVSTSSYESYGGGVYMNNGTFTMNGGKISNNSSNYTSSSSSSSYISCGGGLYVNNGTFAMNNGEISGNTTTGYAATRTLGGGVYLIGTLRMSGGVIYGSNASIGKNTSGNSSSALFKASSGVAQYGTLTGSTFVRTGDLNTTDTTIRIVNGALQTN